MASYTPIDKLIEIADNRSIRTGLMSRVSAITLAGCMGGGGGGTFGVFGGGGYIGDTTYCDEGTASRFFYSTKSSVKERTHNRTIENDHPTVKNLELMKYLIKLITPKGGTVFDPFAGSGTTLIAAKELGFSSVGVELSEEYCRIIQDRIQAVTSPLEQML